MLHALLEKYSDLFEGTLGKWKMDEYDVELRPDAKPYQIKGHVAIHIAIQIIRYVCDTVTLSAI